ncbi:hypothetical protein pb186bvf_001938 [Paramecium bursaria]
MINIIKMDQNRKQQFQITQNTYIIIFYYNLVNKNQIQGFIIFSLRSLFCRIEDESNKKQNISNNQYIQCYYILNTYIHRAYDKVLRMIGE